MFNSKLKEEIITLKKENKNLSHLLEEVYRMMDFTVGNMNSATITQKLKHEARTLFLFFREGFKKVNYEYKR